MPTPLRPKGPLPARVYWTRRLLVLGFALLLVVGLAKVLGGSSDATDDPPAAARLAGADPTTSPLRGESLGPTVPATAGTASDRPDAQHQKKKRKKREPLAEPEGPCSDSDIVVTPDVAKETAGSDIGLDLLLSTRTSPACTWQVSAETLALTITSGSDHIWSSRQCPEAIPTEDVIVRQAVDTPVTVTWNARRSDEDCSRFTEWALPGYYHLEAAALAGEPTRVQFRLVRPTSAVITKTVTPKPEKQRKPGKKRDGKRDHAAGDSGGGTSEPNG